MGGVASKDVRVALELCHALADTDDPVTLTDLALEGLLSLLRCDLSGFNTFDVPTGRAAAVLFPLTRSAATAAQQLPGTMHDNPMLQHYLATGDFRPRVASDIVSQQRWRASATYADMLRPLGVRHMLALPLQLTGDTGSGYVFVRSGPDFGDRERELALLVQGALAAHHRRVGFVVDDRPASTPGHTGHRQGTELTRRETEVLTLLAQGQTAESIARRLAVSPTTVRKHLEHIYAKAGVHDRLLAVGWARAHGLLPQASPHIRRAAPR